MMIRDGMKCSANKHWFLQASFFD